MITAYLIGFGYRRTDVGDDDGEIDREKEGPHVGNNVGDCEGLIVGDVGNWVVGLIVGGSDGS